MSADFNHEAETAREGRVVAIDTRPIFAWATLGAIVGLATTPYSSGNESAVVILAGLGATIGAILMLRIERRRNRGRS